MSQTGISLEELRKKGLGAVKASKEEIFGLKGSILVTCKSSGLSIGAWKDALRMTLKDLESVRRR